MGRVAVVGSANIDHVVRVPHLPRTRETVLGSGYAQHMGGKGANQAVAACRLGAAVRFIGALGTDEAGDLAVQSLEAEGVDCTAVARIPEAASGVALITVDAQGENQIAVAPGANLLIDPGQVAARIGPFQPALVLAVLEISMAVVLSAAQAAKDSGARVLLNAAPAQPLPDALLATGPLISVNADELKVIGPSAAVLLERGVRGVVVTRGPDGSSVVTQDGEISIPGERAGIVVDATGAGDTFSGAMAALLADGLELAQAARMANAAAGLSVLRAGARGGMPTRSELEDYLERSPSA
jgi:ribokinase